MIRVLMLAILLAVAVEGLLQKPTEYLPEASKRFVTEEDMMHWMGLGSKDTRSTEELIRTLQDQLKMMQRVRAVARFAGRLMDGEFPVFPYLDLAHDMHECLGPSGCQR